MLLYFLSAFMSGDREIFSIQLVSQASRKLIVWQTQLLGSKEVRLPFSKATTSLKCLLCH